MSKTATQSFSFLPQKEAGQNPYVGIMSFQHFRGEAMYSDIEVRPENKMTETERVEVYPPSPDAEELGRQQGYYPDSSLVYIRILWKEFEPQQGQYNYAFIEDILQKAEAHGQMLILRLMAHSTRAQDDVPDFLKTLVKCPQRPPMQRVKDSPTDPLYLELFLQAVQRLGRRFDGHPYFYAIDISLPGAWGEGHNLHLFGENTLERIVDVYTQTFKHTQLFGQMGMPEMIHYGSKTVPIGWRGDGLGNPRHTEEIYPPRILQLADVWKTAPVSFESYWWLCEWKRRGWPLERIIEKTLEWHISSFNPKSMPIPPEWQPQIEYWLSRMGYHFTIRRFTCPVAASAGSVAEFSIEVENTGVAPIYKEIPFLIRLRGAEQRVVLPTDICIKDWFPGSTVSQTQVQLPQALPKGQYAVEISVQNQQIPMLYFATNAPQNGAFYTVGNINIES